MHELIAEQLRAGTALVLTCHDAAFPGQVARYAPIRKLKLRQ